MRPPTILLTIADDHRGTALPIPIPLTKSDLAPAFPMRMSSLLLMACVLFFGGMSPGLSAEPTVADIFSNGMVLQQNLPIPVWGSAADGTEVTVTFGGSSVSGTASGGRWRVELPAQKANSAPQKMVVKFREGNAMEIDDVLVGEVWLCAGQSNMDQRIHKKPPRELRDMPLVRQFSKGRGKDSSNVSKWTPAVGEDISLMSMTAIYFGEKLFNEMNVPVGLILAAVSGTPIESWIPKTTMEADPDTKSLMARSGDPEVRKKLSDTREKMRENPEEDGEGDLLALVSLGKPGVLHAMHIQPTVPYAIRGAIWYQGEANSKVPENSRLYGKYLSMLVASLRKDYGQADLPFFLVQLPSIEEGRKEQAPRVYEIVREQQRRFVQNTPHTGLAVSIDVNEGLHPRHKDIIGDRLAKIALAETYGKKPEGAYAGPQLKTVTFDGRRAICTFDHAAGGLQLKNHDAGLFEIAGEDGKFQPATAVVDGEKLVVESANVAEARAVRYAYKPAMAAVSLFGAGSLPASPFLYP